MSNLISKDENIKNSSVYIGYIILSYLKKDNRISIYKVYEVLRKKKIVNTRQIMFSLMFLYESGIIKFEEPYICKV